MLLDLHYSALCSHSYLCCRCVSHFAMRQIHGVCLHLIAFLFVLSSSLTLLIAKPMQLGLQGVYAKTGQSVELSHV